MQRLIGEYLQSIKREFATGIAAEHAYRPALKHLLDTTEKGLNAVNDPKRSAVGAPDFQVLRGHTTIGFIEAKDLGIPLAKTENEEQMRRYLAGFANLILTNYLEFRWYVRGELQETVRIAKVEKNSIYSDESQFENLTSLLQSFVQVVVPTVKTARELAQRMAATAHLIRDFIFNDLSSKDPSNNLISQRNAFRKTLLPDIDDKQFADMYAQTVAYGLFAARVNFGGSPSEFSRRGAGEDIPRTNPFLRKLFGSIGLDLGDRTTFLVDVLADLLAHTDISEVLKDFGKATRQEDPIVHFYETFLREYDPKLREKRGVYYTPEPVVSYIVRSVDYVLREHFKRRSGLADNNTLILDPATGTGTFLYFAIRHIHDTAFVGQAGIWDSYVRDHLLKRIFGFELLMAPYSVAHMKLGLMLEELGYTFDDGQRLGVFLTNTLEESALSAENLFAQFISDETNEAAAIKHDKPIVVVMGNPPYSSHSANRSEEPRDFQKGDTYIKGWSPKKGGGASPVYGKAGKLFSGKKQPTFIGQLIRDYYFVDEKPLGEPNSKWLQDDYVKFIRFGQWRIEQTGYGVLAFITSHGYLDNPTFKGLRQNLMQTFTDIYIVDLHGNSNRKERTPEGEKDQNVFDIKQGVAIAIFIKEQNKAGTDKIYHFDLWGDRQNKYDWLLANNLNSTMWKEIAPQSPSYLFTPQETELLPEYSQFWSVTKIFSIHGSTVTTARNHFSLDSDRQELLDRVNEFADPTISDQTIRHKYSLKDVSYWNLKSARETIYNVSNLESYIKAYCYRPFDFQYIIHHPALCERPRYEVMSHMLKDNVALLTHRPQSPENFTFAYCTNMIGDQNIAANKSAGGGNSFQFPLYHYPEEKSSDQLFSFDSDDHTWPLSEKRRRPNFNPEFVQEFSGKLGLTFITDGKGDLETTFGPDNLFAYIYAVLHCPDYRERYAGFLKTDFPHIPLISDVNLFRVLVAQGEQLVDLHLMTSRILDKFITSYPIKGSNVIAEGYPKYTTADQRIWINPTQYFEDITLKIWEFEVGGYKVLERWLKDRRGSTLNYDEIQHYQRIIVALHETIRIMDEINNVIPAWPLR